MNDLDRARELGLTVEQFQSLVGNDPMESHQEFIQGGTTGPYDVEKDGKKKDKDKKQGKAMDKQDPGFHVHDESNPFGLHSHYPGGPLGGAHTHGAQNMLGHHTHRYNKEELLQFKFAQPGIMIDLDGPHNHEANTPEGYPHHAEGLDAPASGKRAEEVAARNTKVDKN